MAIGGVCNPSIVTEHRFEIQDMRGETTSGGTGMSLHHSWHSMATGVSLWDHIIRAQTNWSRSREAGPAQGEKSKKEWSQEPGGSERRSKGCRMGEQ